VASSAPRLESIANSRDAGGLRLSCPPSFSAFAEIKRFKEAIADYELRNAQLATAIGLYGDQRELDPALIENLDLRLNYHVKFLEERRVQINDLENKIRRFREADIDIKDQPKRCVNVDRSQKAWFYRAPAKYQPPRPKPFPPPASNQRAKVAVARNRLLQEHRELTEKSLYLERMIVLGKMRLKLKHDQRDLAQLRNELYESGAGEGDDYVNSLKEKIKTIKEKITKEREMIQDERDMELLLARFPIADANTSSSRNKREA
jgi:hypothetical protein